MATQRRTPKHKVQTFAQFEKSSSLDFRQVGSPGAMTEIFHSMPEDCYLLNATLRSPIAHYPQVIKV